MPFIKSFSIVTNKKKVFPYNIRAVQFARQVMLDERVTIFVGDNRCGKSTLLETIALYLNISLIGGYIQSHVSFEAAEKLKSSLKIEWHMQLNKGFFFRAEDFSDFVNAVEQHREKLYKSYGELRGRLTTKLLRR